MRIERMATVTILALVLLWAQTWGQWHGVLHAQSAPLVVPGVVKTLGYADGHEGQPATIE